ncbi:phosphatidylglycerophosphate phosphatase PTPMT1 [Rhodamnia argentea]|uniref:phosphatidylglycerophosphatase n=1 Tax=Rhodamnia argentea TaxID=178133 RepID=A0A8B8MTD1_9MYRT|nr:phosphatidylglycerophosphate phosphatase PTPMT1 [Rhodamnia argentea]
MYIEELKEGGEVDVGAGVGGEVGLCVDGEIVLGNGNESVVPIHVKRAVIGAGARALFYPTLLYNVVRNRIQVEFRWWDRIGEFILLGAVPFPSDVPCLKKLGVDGVVTLNEPYETLVPTALYKAYGINHLVIPTRDYCFAPSLHSICRAVEFIHENASCGRTTYVHCKAGRGRSTTIVICYLVQHKDMTPDAAYDYVKSIRPRVLLATSQWQAVQQFYYLKVKKVDLRSHLSDLVFKTCVAKIQRDRLPFDDGSVVVVTESDLVGYDPSLECGDVKSDIWADLRVVYRVRYAGQSALARISCLWLRCRAEKVSGEQVVTDSGCAIGSNHLSGISVDIHVY